jgi:hypothetical protein
MQSKSPAITNVSKVVNSDAKDARSLDSYECLYASLFQ